MNLRQTLFILISLFACTSFGVNYTETANRLIRNIDTHINMSMLVVDLNTGKTIFERNANQVLIPASNMKLFSQASALLALGQNYSFNNTLSTDAAKLENNVLYGNLYVNLPGDPSLTSQDVYNLIASLTKWGIKLITGDIIIVSPNQFVNSYAPGRLKEDIPRSYGASIAPVIINENTVTVAVGPGRTGNLARISFDDPYVNLLTSNQIKTSRACKRPIIGLYLNKENHLFAHGCINPKHGTFHNSLAILNPGLYAQDIISNSLKATHITLQGNIYLGSAPKSTMLFASHVSEPLSKLMADTLKPSDNVYADSLFLHAARQLNGSPLNWDRAQHVVKTYLQRQTGTDLSQAIIVDGSGLSRLNRVSAKQTVALLSYIYRHFPLAQNYIAALPIAGVDGTLEKRFRKPSTQGNIRAKTGYMKGIFGLSGYAYTPNGHTLAFSIFINRTPRTRAKGSYRELIDRLCEVMVRQQPKGGTAYSKQNNPSNYVSNQLTPLQSMPTFEGWKQLETALRKALDTQNVSITYYPNSLILQDKSANASNVLTTLQNLSQKYPFAVALEASRFVESNQQMRLLWIKNNQLESSRTWKIFPTVN